MKHAYTPGPWTNDGDAIIAPNDLDFVATQVTNQADANLIAAAPEMLEALETLRSIAALVPDDVWAKASDEYNRTLGVRDINEYKFSMDISKAAIAKARGGK